MKKGQVGMGLVLLGVVAIVAVIGLVLLFTKASSEGAAIGISYGDSRGILPVREQSQALRNEWGSTPFGPQTQYASADIVAQASQTVGGATPAFVISSLDYADLVDPHNECRASLYAATTSSGGGFVKEAIEWFNVPLSGSTGEVVGMYPGPSSARADLAQPLTGRGAAAVGFVGSGLDQQQVVELLAMKLPTNMWRQYSYAGKTVLYCDVMTAKGQHVFGPQ